MIGGLILAAGEGKRFGQEPKLLSPLAGRPLLEHAVRAQCEVARLETIVVVLGAHADEIRARLDFGRARPVFCAPWKLGVSQSLRRGVSELGTADKVIVTLGDQPLITPAAIERMAAEPPGTRALYDGTPGHPVVLGPQQIAALAELDGDRGAGGLLEGGRTVECGGLARGWDIDTPEDLEAVRALVEPDTAARLGATPRSSVPPPV